MSDEQQQRDRVARMQVSQVRAFQNKYFQKLLLNILLSFQSKLLCFQKRQTDNLLCHANLEVFLRIIYQTISSGDNYMLLKGSVAILAGAGRQNGVGAATARLLAKEGCNIFINCFIKTGK